MKGEDGYAAPQLRIAKLKKSRKLLVSSYTHTHTLNLSTCARRALSHRRNGAYKSFPPTSAASTTITVSQFSLLVQALTIIRRMWVECRLAHGDLVQLNIYNQ